MLENFKERWNEYIFKRKVREFVEYKLIKLEKGNLNWVRLGIRFKDKSYII